MADPYDVLGVPPGSDPETIQAAFGRLSRRIPPERRAADPAAAAAFQEIAAAYASLSNPERRARQDAFEAWGKGGPDLQGPPPRAAAAAPRAAEGDETKAASDATPELKPGEEFNLRRFKGNLCVYAGLVMAARGAIGVYFDPSGWLNRLARQLPWIGELEQEPAFLVMIAGMALIVWGAGSFMITDREAEELERRAGRRRLFRRVRPWPF